MKVDKYLLLVLCVAIAPTWCLARLGETQTETTKRYGPSHAYAGPGIPPGQYTYQAQGFDIFVRFGDRGLKLNGQEAAGRSIHEVFTSRDKLTDAQIAAILEANKGSSAWGQPRDEQFMYSVCPTWRTTDGTRIAHLTGPDELHPNGQSLVVRWVEAPKTPQGF